MEVIEKAALPIYSWSSDLEEGALAQAVNCANLPVTFHHVAVMADGHQGYGVPIGAVVAMREAISPYAVGNDIGCGMGLVPTNLHRDQIGPVRSEIMGWIQNEIPSGSEARKSDRGVPEEIEPLLNKAFDAMEQGAAASRLPLTTSQSLKPDSGRPINRSDFVNRGKEQCGTLGAGNHFVELLAGPDGDVALLIHSGSRGTGGIICANFHRFAHAYVTETGVVLPDPGLAWLPLDSGSCGVAYVAALAAGLEYARLNRQTMLELAGKVVEERFPGSLDWNGLINIHHNDATLETHFGKEVWVHRKGAVKAPVGASTITPGSMGTSTVVGRGLGKPESYSSCSHGAGRKMSRGRAKANLNLQDQLKLIEEAGGKVFARSKEGVLDEMPGAYKDLDEVMHNQRDLVEVVKRYTPIATYKGVEQRGRSGRREAKRERER